MVLEDKKMGEVQICVDLRKLNDACLHDLFLTPFTDEVLEGVAFNRSIHLHMDFLSIIKSRLQNRIGIIQHL